MILKYQVWGLYWGNINQKSIQKRSKAYTLPVQASLVNERFITQLKKIFIDISKKLEG